MATNRGGGGGGGGGLRYDFGFYPSQNMEGIKKHRKIFILRVTPLYSTLEVLQNTDVYMYIGIYTTYGTI